MDRAGGAPRAAHDGGGGGEEVTRHVEWRQGVDAASFLGGAAQSRIATDVVLGGFAGGRGACGARTLRWPGVTEATGM